MKKNSPVVEKFPCVLRKLLLVALATLALMGTQQAAQAAQPDIDAIILPLMEKHRIPGLALGILDNGKIRFYNYGVASKQTSEPVTENTLFEIGSLSKTFTATLAAYAMQTGRLHPDDPASRTFFELKGSAFDHISLMNLATHTSTVPLFVPDNVTNRPELMHWYKNWKPSATPGTKRVYSNLGIGLLGIITAKRLGQPFVQIMEKEMLPAMGMTHTYIHVPAAQMPCYAQGYNRLDEPVRVNPGMLDAESYGVKSDTRDLIRWLGIQTGTVRVSDDWQKAIRQTHTGYYRTPDFTQAMMWEYYPLPVEKRKLVSGNNVERIMKAMPATPIEPPETTPRQAWFNKTGSTNGFSTYAVFIPSSKTAVIFLANKWIPNDDRVIVVHDIIGKLEGQKDKPGLSATVR